MASPNSDIEYTGDERRGDRSNDNENTHVGAGTNVNEGDGGHLDEESHRRNPSREVDSQASISLAQRAPAGPIPTRTWNAYLKYGINHVELEKLLEQKNQCVRSRLAHRSLNFHVSIEGSQGIGTASGDVSNKRTSYPYPASFQRTIPTQSAIWVNPLPQDAENRVATDGRDSAPESKNSAQGEIPTPMYAYALGQAAQSERREWRWGVTTRWFGIIRTTAIEMDTTEQPVYVVLGVFTRGYSTPRERVVFIHKPKQFFWRLSWAVFRLRGVGRTFFSLRHVKGFRLYKCDAETGTHQRVTLDSNGVTDLQVLLDTYKKWHVPSHISLAWANWIHFNLNAGSYDLLKGSYSVELILDWSAARISVVVLLPVLLSLAIGLWLNSSAWTDLATIQTAWGTASYVVTAGGLLAALLGILSTIGDGKPEDAKVSQH